MIEITNTRLEHTQALEEIQRLVFGHLPQIAQFTAAMYSRHIEVFPEGQFTALITEGDQLVVAGATTTFRTADFDHIRHPFDGGTSWLSDHDPDGEWLYGVDISVHPHYQRRGVATQIYVARAELVRRLNLRGEVAAGLLAGFHRYQNDLTIEQYVEKLITGELIDPTVSAQMRNGFIIRDILYNYVENPQSNNCAALIVRENRFYQPPR